MLISLMVAVAFTMLFFMPKKSLVFLTAVMLGLLVAPSNADACGRGAGVGSGGLFHRLAALRQRIRPQTNVSPCTSCQGCQFAQLPAPQFPSVVAKVVVQSVAKVEKPKPALPTPTFTAPAVQSEPVIVLPATAQSASGSSYTRSRTVTVQSGVQSASTCPDGNCPQSSGASVGWRPGAIFGGLFGRR